MGLFKGYGKLITISILILALSGGLIYETFFNRDPTDPDYINVLESDYNSLITRVGVAEKRNSELIDRIGKLESASTEIAGELEDSRAEVSRLITERDNQRRLTEEARRELENSSRTASDIGERGINAENSARRAIDIINGFGI